MFKVTIGDRGTDSPVLSDHRAFLFDKEKGLLVLPISLAEIRGERTSANQYGEYVFQGAYVYDVNLQNGFTLRGRVTQYDDTDAFMKSGYYFYGDRSITRSLYIDNVLYTLSNTRLQLNDLSTLDRIKALDLQSLTTATPGPTVAPTPAPHHVAYFTSNVTAGAVPLAVQFTDASTGSPTGWQWSWGDETANGTIRNPVHVYNAPGLYTVTLTVTGPGGSNTTRKTGYINVSTIPVPTPTPTPEPTATPTPTPTPTPGPVAGFSGNITTGLVPLVVQFTDESTGSPTGWQWSWDDLTANGTVRNPVHIFNATGLYTIMLTVTNSNGSNTTVKVGYINVTAT
jgi:PKD repeat protein